TAQAIATMGAPTAAKILGHSSTKPKHTVIARAVILRTSKGRWLEVKISSASKHARIAIHLLDRKQVVAKDTRTIATNRTIRVLKVGARVTGAKIALA